jgi:beta-ureidopropionase / N-carbamoyl-L-amino-acid hydrolase
MTFDRLWDDLAPVGREGSTGGYRRYAWTATDATLREWFAGEAAARGLDLVVDRAGNQWAWWGNPDASGPGVVVGSHLDSVPDGGAFDGPLGVVSGLLTIDALRTAGVRPSRPVGVVNFGDEEGARFGVACAGSRMVTGTLPRDRALGLRDGDGTSMAEAMSAAGQDLAHVGRDEDTLRRIGCFVELHVEQGRGLIDLGRPVAVGTGIWPHGRWRMEFAGEANHAGTTRLEDRHDPMLDYAAAVLQARELARKYGIVATCGKVVVEPNGINAIPSRVRGWLDARGADAGAVRALVAELSQDRDVREESWTPATPFHAGLSDRCAAVLDDAPRLASGAGHDAGVLAEAGVATAMLFVRNPTGISHSPAEFAERDDCLRGVHALTAIVTDLVLDQST